MLSDKKTDKMLAIARISRLAEKYGPFVRFYPEGSEGTGEGIEKHEETPIEDPDKKPDGALESAIEAGEKAAKTPEEQKAIDDARKSEQQLEQEKANAERAREVARQAQTDLAAANSETEKLKEQLAAAEAKATEAGIADVELDEKEYEGTDLAIVRAIKAVNQKIAAKDTEIKSLQKKATGYETQAAKDEATAAQNSAYEELLTDLDTEYGADIRNDALKLWQEKVKDGKVPKGKPAQATRIMERCYKEAKTAKEKASTKKDKSGLPLDKGSGGGETPNLSGVEIKEGSLDEVDAQVAKTSFGSRKS